MRTKAGKSTLVLTLLACVVVLASAMPAFAGVSISSPASNSGVSSPIHVVASASSSYPITAMRIYLDSNSVYTANASSLDTYIQASSGAHYLIVQAWDSTGAVFKSAQTINVSSTAAAGVTVASPSNGATISSPVPFNAKATASSGLPITAMRVYIDNASAYTVNSDQISTALPVAAGSHNAVVQAWDNAGNVYKSVLSFAVAGSTSTAGGVTVSSPMNGASVSSPVQFAAAATGNSGLPITAMRIYVDNTSAYTTASNQLNTSVALGAGSHNIVVQAWDSAGTVYQKPLSVSVGSASSSVAVSVTPTSALLNVGKTQQFSASVSGSTNTGVTWAVNGVQGGNSTVGTISTSGLYTAPAAVPSNSTVTVSATSVADTTKSANATVTIAAAPATVSVSITPTSASLTTGQTKQFSATVSGSTSTGVTWQVNGVTGGSSSTGTISTAGLYTAPATVPSGGSVTVTARSSYSTSQYANATVSIAASPTPTSGTGNKWYVANGGSNNSSCGGSSNPCATPDYAYNNRAVAGDTVIVAPGTYDYGSGAGASFTKSGAAGKYITVTCSQRWACKIQNSVTGNSTVVYIAGSYLTFDGFEVTNTSSTGNNLGLYVTSSYVNITRNKIHHIETDCGSNGGGGIQIAGSGSSAGTGHDITMDGNLIYDISWTTCNNKPSVVQTDGILAETFGANVIITNNIVHHVAGGWGITAGAAKTIANNLVFTVANGGILLTANGSGAYITNNMVFNTGIVSGQCGIMVDPNISVTYGNNMFYGNKGANYCIEWGSPAASLRTGDQSVDPAQGTLFVNWNADGTGDYHLKSGAPAIDKGMSTNAPNHDMDSNARPRGAGYDIGPYEF